MEFTVYHHSFIVLGGSERVAVSVISVLKYLGYKVRLVTSYFDKEKVKKWDKNFIEPDEVVIKKSPIKIGWYNALYFSLLTKPGNSISTIGDITHSDFSYIHFPFSLSNNLGKMGISDEVYYRKMNLPGGYFSEKFKFHFIPYKYAQSFYSTPYKYAYKLFFRNSKSRLLANSSWTGKILEYSGYSYTVLYPPVDVEKFLSIKSDKKRDPKLVISIGRVSPEKNLENLLYVASKLKEYKFVILGATGKGEYRIKYYDYIVNEAKKLGNVEIISNFTDDVLLKYLSEASVYFHSKINEHFGISIVEALAAGLVPVVHKSGGAWYDIVKEGKYGFGYETADEAVNAVVEASKYENDFRDYANEFSFEKFKDRFSSILG
ncbi:glycosyltransferase [Acidianus sulfidivorans JP7]|uniref:glycosyltransferase n=1 Tax=Acidianus sulfidivorans TaxID=312539 RepID=UPI001443777F|nr:glycosyltransferase [Acidianus sulfidivorans]AWR97825.2 glycosyltransferase [Acidianus sulfidivorans JP7]